MNFFNNKDPVSPVSFGNTGAENPIGFFSEDVNTSERFAINKLTENGKFVRGNMLYYNFNGVEIYTELNNIIFVDTINNTLFIKEYKKVINELSPEDPEKRQYIVLYTEFNYENSPNPLFWEASEGRTNAYENIKSNAPGIDIDLSIVIVDNVSISESLTVREFVNYLKNANMVQEDGFDINEYDGSLN